MPPKGLAAKADDAPRRNFQTAVAVNLSREPSASRERGGARTPFSFSPQAFHISPSFLPTSPKERFGSSFFSCEWSQKGQGDDMCGWARVASQVAAGRELEPGRGEHC